MKCSASVLCRHSFVSEMDDDVTVDREGRDLQRLACLNSAEIIVTSAPASVRFQHSSGGWVAHDEESIAQVEIMLFKAYRAIESQILFGGSSLLLGLDPEAERDPAGEDSYLHNSMVEDMRKRANMRVMRLMETVTRRHLSALAARIPVYAQDPAFYDLLTRLPATDFDQVKVRPVLALADGGAIDLSPQPPYARDAAGIFDPASYGLMRRTHHDRGAVELDPEVLNRHGDPALDLARRLLDTHYPDEFIQLAAYLLAYPADDLISVIMGESGTGKTLFWQWVGWATGSAQVSDISLLTTKSQFTPLEAALARCHVVVLDEGDAAKGTPIPFGQLNRATAERFDVNDKYGAFRPAVPRLGALVLVGNDWPAFDSTTPGLDRRVAWAWDTPLPAAIGKASYDTLAKSRASHQLMLGVLVAKARDLQELGIEAARASLMTPAVLAARQRMVDATTNPLKKALDDVVERGDAKDYITAERLKALVKEADVGTVPTQEIKRVMAMFGASNGTRRIGGKSTRMWIGVRERTEAGPERNGASSEPVPAPLPCPVCGREGGVLTAEGLCADTAQCAARRGELIRTGEWR